MNLCLTFSHFEELYKNGYSVDMLFLLKLAQEGNDIKSLCDGSPKLGALFQGVVRKGLLTEDSKLTLSGRNVLDVLNKETIEKPLSRKAPDKTDDFERWWKAYPGTDTFAYKGKTFEGTRSLRTKKDDCKIKLTKILNSTATAPTSALTDSSNTVMASSLLFIEEPIGKVKVDKAILKELMSIRRVERSKSG